MEEKQIARHIIYKLARKNIWGGRHTAFEKLFDSVPAHLKGAAKKAARGLIKKGILIAKPTAYGPQVSLNPRMKETIDGHVQEYGKRK